jgi:hypothetical protein
VDGHDGPRARRDGGFNLVEINVARIRPTSTKTGRAPTRTMTLAVATKLRAGVITSSPGPIPQARSAISMPAVAEVWVLTGRPPRYFESSLSSAATFGPVASHPERSTSTTD